MTETPDRWHNRLFKTARSHGRIAVISSSVTAGALLIVGSVLVANATDSAKDVQTTRPVSSTAAEKGAGGSNQSNSTVTTTSLLPGATSPSVVESGAQDSVTTNTTITGALPGGVTTVPAPGASTTAPTTITPTPNTILGSTTTAAPRRAINGQSLPTILADATSSTDDPLLKFKLTAGDKDGYLTRIVVNWNDQSPWTTIDYPLASCVEPLNSLVTPTISHNYTTAGSYMVTITVTSVNCSGEGEQQSIITKPVSVGGSNQTTTTTAPSGPPTSTSQD